MSDDFKTTEDKECKCFCKSKGFRKFLVIALGTFTGFYLALCLFAAVHKPPCHCGCSCHRAHFSAPCPCYEHHRHHFYKGVRGEGDFQRVMPEPQEPSPFESNREGARK